MTTPTKKNPQQIKKKVPGWLICNECKRSHPILSHDPSDKEQWPKHRCGLYREPKPFTRWTDKEPRTKISDFPAGWL